MNLAASSFDAASASQVRLKDAYLGGLKEEQQGDLSHEKEENSEGTDDSESEPWYYKRVAQTDEPCGKPLAGKTAEYESIFFFCDKFFHRVESDASKSPGMPMASGKPDRRISVDPSSFDAASTSQVRLKDSYFGGLMEKQRGNPSHQEEADSEESDIPEAEIWYYKGKLVAQNNKAWQKPLAHGASSSVD